MDFWNSIKNKMIERGITSVEFLDEKKPKFYAYGTKCVLHKIRLSEGEITLYTSKGTLKGILPIIDEENTNLVLKEFSTSIWERIALTPNGTEKAVDFLQMICDELYSIGKGDVEFDTIKGIVTYEIAKTFALLPLKVLEQVKTV